MIKTTVKKMIPERLHLVLGDIKRAAVSYLHRGNNVECPCCGWRFSRFLQHKKRGDVLCPRCNSLERHRLIWLFLMSRTNLFNARTKLLHVAPEVCFSRRFKRMQNIDYLTGDLYNPAMIKLDVTDMQFADNTFDAVICNHVLEHVPNDRRAMREIYRVLKPGGWAILQVPIRKEMTYEDPSITSPEDRLRHYGQEDHVRWYGYDYPDRLAEAGFEVKVEPFAEELGDNLITRYKINRKHKIYFCRKPSN